MKSRARIAFRPRIGIVAGMDVLEDRQLLSAVGKSAEFDSRDRTQAAVVTRADPPSDVQAASAASQVTSAADASAGDAVDGAGGSAGRGVAPVVASVRSTNNVSTPVDAASLDEGTISASADSSVVDHPGEGGASINNGVLPAAPGDGVNPGVSAGPVVTTLQARSGPATSALVATPPGGEGTTGVAPAGTLLLTDGLASESPGPASVRLAWTPGGDAAKSASGLSGDDELRLQAEADRAAAPPRCADLLAEFLPYPRAILEDAIDHFLAPLENLGTDLAIGSPTTRLLAGTAILGAASVATVAVRQRFQRSLAARAEAEEDFAWFPGYPRAWRPGES